MSAIAQERAVGFGRTLHAEWIKLRSLRSTWFTLAGLFAAGLAVSGMAMTASASGYPDLSAADRAAWDPTALSLRTFIIAQLIIGVLGTLAVTSEYATGMMQTSLAATPRRHRLLAAKALLVAAVAVVAGQALMLVSFLLGQAVLGAGDAPTAGLGDPGVPGALLGGGLYLAAIALLATGLGVVLRSTAGALTTLVAVIFLAPGLSAMFPSWTQGLFDFWPTQGGAAVMATVADPDYPHPWVNLGGMCLGIAALLAAGFVLFRRRDV